MSRSIPRYHDGVDEPTPPKRPDSTAEPRASENPLQRAASGRFAMMRSVGALATVGMAFAFAILISVGIGIWLDHLTGWSPVFFIGFFVIGVATGILNVYRMTSRLMK